MPKYKKILISDFLSDLAWNIPYIKSCYFLSQLQIVSGKLVMVPQPRSFPHSHTPCASRTKFVVVRRMCIAVSFAWDKSKTIFKPSRNLYAPIRRNLRKWQLCLCDVYAKHTIYTNNFPFTTKTCWLLVCIRTDTHTHKYIVKHLKQWRRQMALYE